MISERAFIQRAAFANFAVCQGAAHGVDETAFSALIDL